jgi:predicted dehydrogenase
MENPIGASPDAPYDASMPDRAPRLAVLGWSDSVEQLLPQLCSLLGFSIVGVGDRSAAALIRARRSTNAPYFQHTAEMIRRLEYDVLLVADTDAAIELVPRAASRGAHLIGEASSLSASALDAVATAAVRRGVPLALARPLLRRPAVEAALQLVRDDARWRPSLVTIELGGPRAEEQQLRDAVALATRLVPEPPHQVTAAAAPSARHVAASSATRRTRSS